MLQCVVQLRPLLQHTLTATQASVSDCSGGEQTSDVLKAQTHNLVLQICLQRLKGVDDRLEWVLQLELALLIT